MFKIYCKSSKFTLTALLRSKAVNISSAQWLTWPWLPDRIVQFWGGSAALFSSSLVYSLARAIMVFGWCVEFILGMKPIISCVMIWYLLAPLWGCLLYLFWNGILSTVVTFLTCEFLRLSFVTYSWLWLTSLPPGLSIPPGWQRVSRPHIWPKRLVPSGSNGQHLSLKHLWISFFLL